MKIAYATPADVEAWRSLAREIEPLFGPMADEASFRDALQQAISNHSAIGLRMMGTTDPGRLAGGIVMVNMIKFRDKAHYDDGPSERSGRDAYALYSRGALDHVTRAGGEVVWFGKAYTAVIAPPGEAWDEIFMVRYPSIEAFMEMIESLGYREILVHRAAALKDSRLIPVIEQKARPAKPTAPSNGPSGKTVK